MIDYFPLPQGSLTGVHTQGGWYISSYFGSRKDPITGIPGNHGGQDLVCPTGTPLYAVCRGKVAQGWDGSGGGNWSGLTAEDGSYFGYGHALRFEPNVVGRIVDPGQVIAYADSTGHSTGAHLHFAYRAPGQYAYSDPFDLLEECANAGRFVGVNPPAITPEDPSRKCAPGAGDKTLHIIGRDPRDGKVYEICDLYAKYIPTPELRTLLHEQLGIEDRDDVAPEVIDSRVKV